MKAIVINSSNTFEYRVNLVCETLVEMGYEVLVITSDFSHTKKEHIFIKRNNYKVIHTKRYKRNISFARLLSHYKFSVDAYKAIQKEDVDLLYLLIPPNSQAKIGEKYRKYKKTKIIMDIIDLWPESFPIKNTSLFPFTMWANIRNKSLQYADCIICECELYKTVLKKYYQKSIIKILYWCKKAPLRQSSPQLDPNKIALCYLGSINNIIDIDLIVDIVKNIRKESLVKINIIGTGEKKKVFIEKLSKIDVEILDWGIVYDEEKKQKIFDTCNFGLNIMKENVAVGMTMKSIDYLAGGLPIINNIGGDTYQLVEEEKIGINWNKNYLYNSNIMNNIYQEEMRMNAKKIFDEIFEEKVFKKKLKSIIEQM